MAYQALGLGSVANDGTGDSLRTGGDKVNDNFVEIYTKLGDGSTLSADTVTLNTASQTLTNKTLTSPTITGTGAIAGAFTGNVDGNCTGTSGSTTGNAATATALAAAVNIAGVSFDGSGAITIASTDLSDTASICLAANTLTLTNKTLTAPIIGGDITTASGNLTVDTATQIVEIKGDGTAVEGMIKLNCHANTHGQTIKPQPHSASVTNTMLLPAGANSTLVSLVSADTLTNKSIDLTDNTVTGTMAELNTAISDETVVGRSTTDTLTNKTLADLKTSVQTLSGAGAIDVVTGVTEVTTTAADALTLANGTVGQLKIITMVADGGDGTITPTTFANGTTITMNDVGDTVVLVYVTTRGWTVINNIGCTVA